MENPIVIEGDTAIVTLVGGEKTQVDVTDLARMTGLRWSASRRPLRNLTYAVCLVRQPNGGLTTVYLHRLLVDAPRGKDVDHRNHDTLDNRRRNLRVVTHAENMQNLRGARRDSQSGVRGVSWSAAKCKYLVRVTINGTARRFGEYRTLEEAERVAQDVRASLMTNSSEW